MTKTREKSDRCIVPKKGGNAPGGRAATASEQARQLGLFTGEDESPQGADGQAARDGSQPARRAVHIPENKKRRVMPAMTMEEVADNAYFADQGLVFLTKKWEEYRARPIALAPRQLCLPLG